VLRIHEILVRIRIGDLYLRLMDPNPDSDPDPAIFVSDLQDVNKKVFFSYYFLKVHLHHFSKMMIEGSGSGRPKNIWILRIRIRNIGFPITFPSGHKEMGAGGMQQLAGDLSAKCKSTFICDFSSIKR
jgi:hypothetical protein